MSGATHIVVPHEPSAKDVQAIVDAVGAPDRRGRVKDVVVVCSLARTPAGRALMRKRLGHAGLSGRTASILGWSTVAPKVEPAAAPAPTPEPVPETEPVRYTGVDFAMPETEPGPTLEADAKLKPRRRRKP